MAETGKGFSRAQQNTRDQFRHASWGRTRTPKNILSTHRRGTNGTVGLTVGQGASSLVYNTENQRFLFVEVDISGTLTINGSMHAGSGAAVKLFSSPALPTINADGLYKIEISGIDQISFTMSGGGGDTCTLFAACSTF